MGVAETADETTAAPVTILIYGTITMFAIGAIRETPPKYYIVSGVVIIHIITEKINALAVFEVLPVFFIISNAKTTAVIPKNDN